jgi:hypothetical protein
MPARSYRCVQDFLFYPDFRVINHRFQRTVDRPEGGNGHYSLLPAEWLPLQAQDGLLQLDAASPALCSFSTA